MTVTFCIPAVTDATEEGEILHCTIQHKHEGDGSIWLTNVDELSEENSASLLRAKALAQQLVNRRLQHDVEVRLHERRRTVQGGSWELMLTLGMSALLANTQLPSGVTGTGRVRNDGSIMAVGSYIEKIWASKEYGLTTFLIPYESLTGQKQLEQLQVIPVETLVEAWVFTRDKIANDSMRIFV